MTMRASLISISEYNVCFKVETHNHPSALEPFGGANTGVGGVIRDTLGTGLAAKPLCEHRRVLFCTTDDTCHYQIYLLAHFIRSVSMKVFVSVVSVITVIRWSIPTVNGAIVFDKHFAGNPLVFCGNVSV